MRALAVLVFLGLFLTACTDKTPNLRGGGLPRGRASELQELSTCPLRGNPRPQPFPPFCEPGRQVASDRGCVKDYCVPNRADCIALGVACDGATCCDGAECAAGVCTIPECAPGGDVCDPTRFPCCDGRVCTSYLETRPRCYADCAPTPGRPCPGGDGECCAGSVCIQGECATCKPLGSICDLDAECSACQGLSGRCIGGTCSACINEDESGCEQNRDCCLDRFVCNVDGECTYCIDPGDACTRDDQCCDGGSCDTTTRTCVAPPETDGGLDGGPGGADAGPSGAPASGCDAVRTIACDVSNPSAGCVAPHQVCDGFDQCGNHSDERDCAYCNNNGTCESPGENCARCASDCFCTGPLGCYTDAPPGTASDCTDGTCFHVCRAEPCVTSCAIGCCGASERCVAGMCVPRGFEPGGPGPTCCGTRNCGPDPCNPTRDCGVCDFTAGYECPSDGICEHVSSGCDAADCASRGGSCSGDLCVFDGGGDGGGGGGGGEPTTCGSCACAGITTGDDCERCGGSFDPRENTCTFYL